MSAKVERVSGVLVGECCVHFAIGVSARTASLGLRTYVFEGCPLGLQHPWVDADPGQFCSRALQESGAGCGARQAETRTQASWLRSLANRRQMSGTAV